ncbi:chondroitinase family polysaccharide lyase [Pontiella sulfatireligans]|uniref:Chondroitin sulfate ABC exolyase n=1 Tax=Pontiella sulfatireligans TaxID=2750658 RepID=A0A6C2UFI1_9BACT|nr:chondroitinase family polysaccharide lyase [Pontiella sulfatireligans]VGO18181.1 Chondroitin sulfate ABC exolyase [Pontiella sulfatireligans]
MKRTAKIILNPVLLGAAVALFIPMIGSAYNTPVKSIESFEEGMPAGFSATGNLTLDTRRMKHGEQSVKWEWKGNDQIIFDTPIGYRKQRKLTEDSAALQHVDPTAVDILEPPHGFFMWIHNDEPRPQRIRFEFGRGDEVDCWFDYNLNFKGWRTVALNYDRGDMKGLPREDMTRLTINTPNTGSGTFFIDTIGLSVPMNPRTVNPNPQLPDIDPHARLVSQYEHCQYKFSKLTPTFNLEPLTDEIVADFRTLEKQAMPYWFPESDRATWNDSKIKGIEKKFAKLEIVRDGDNIYGRPLVFGNIMKEYFSETGIPKDELYDGIMSWRYDYCGTLFQIARAWEFTQSADNKAKLETMFMDVFDYGIDQGMAAGAGLGWIHHYAYIIREYIPALFVMREPLERHGRLDEAIKACKWFSGFNQVYREDLVYGYEGRKANDADDMQGLQTLRLVTPLLMKDSPEKARDLKHFSSFFSNVSTAYANALDETFKPDGTIFHHAGHAYGYGGRAIYGSVRTFDILKGTSFQASAAAAQRIKKCARTYFDGLFTKEKMTPKAFASIRFSNYKSAEQFADMLDLMGETYEPLDGFRSLPYTCVGLKRQSDDWMITARTHSKYVYPYESWGRDYFAFALFIANGYLDVAYPDSLDSLTPSEETWHEGIDWLRYPGTTSVRLPFEDIATRVGVVRDEGGEYLFSDQAFSGGVETSYGCGVQAFQFKGHDKYGLESFTGKKSWFFVGNKVVCLGSDIQSDIPGYPVETTLFQVPLSATNEPVLLGGRAVDKFPVMRQLKTKQPRWLIDNRGTGYYVPQGKLHLSRSVQTNPDPHDEGEVSGNFATAWFDHGKTPKDAEYEYVLVADADADQMKKFSRKPTVKVLQKDSSAHVVELSEEDATAYAVYAEKGAAFGEGFVKNVNKQSTFIVKREGKKLRLSVADPDLNIYDGQEDLLPDGTRGELSIYEREWFFWPSRPSKVQITLDGEWKIDELVTPMETVETQPRIISSKNGKTVVEVVCRDGLSAELLLSK